MKRLALTCVLGLLVAVPARADLIDPGMNSVGANGMVGATPNAPWVVESFRNYILPFVDGVSSEAFADHDGGGYGIYFQSSQGNPPWDPTWGSITANVYQDMAGTPGVLYELTGWWGAEENFSGFVTPGANAVFAIDFLDAFGVIASAELDLEAAGLGGAGRGLNWELFGLSAVAPAGTTTVRARGSMIAGVFNVEPGQALVTDEWSLTPAVVPEPASTAVLSVGLGLLALRRRRGGRL